MTHTTTTTAPTPAVTPEIFAKRNRSVTLTGPWAVQTHAGTRAKLQAGDVIEILGESDTRYKIDVSQSKRIVSLAFVPKADLPSEAKKARGASVDENASPEARAAATQRRVFHGKNNALRGVTYYDEAAEYLRKVATLLNARVDAYNASATDEQAPDPTLLHEAFQEWTGLYGVMGDAKRKGLDLGLGDRPQQTKAAKAAKAAESDESEDEDTEDEDTEDEDTEDEDTE